jgi:hypothetical protein
MQVVFNVIVSEERSLVCVVVHTGLLGRVCCLVRCDKGTHDSALLLGGGADFVTRPLDDVPACPRTRRRPQKSPRTLTAQQSGELYRLAHPSHLPYDERADVSIRCCYPKTRRPLSSRVCVVARHESVAGGAAPSRGATISFLMRPQYARSEANSDGEGNRVCSPHGITTHKRAVLPSVPRYDTAEHATEPIGLFPHL